MATEERGRERLGRKLPKKRREPRQASLDIPERFRDGPDADEDFAAPKHSNAVSMHQSIFSMIARAGQQSQTDLGIMEELDSGDSDVEAKRRTQYHNLDGAARMSRLSSAHDFQSPPSEYEDSDGKLFKGKHRKAVSENKLLRSLPKLKMSGRKEPKPVAQPVDLMSSSQFLPPQNSEDVTSPSPDERRMKQKSRNSTNQYISIEKRQNSERQSRHGSLTGVSKSKGADALATRLQQIFEFDGLEEVISGWSH